MSELTTLLIVEDERALSIAIAATVRKCGGTPEIVGSLSRARDFLKQKPVCGMILDIGLPDGNGLNFLETMDPSKRPPTLLITAHGAIENAIAARKLGVTDFFDKPIDFESFSAAIRALVKSKAAPVEASGVASTFIGGAPSMRNVFQTIAHASASREPVLILGETGSGKTTAAKLIANHSDCEVRHFSPETGITGLEKLLTSDEKNYVLFIDPISDLDPTCQIRIANGLENPRSNFRLIATAPLDLVNRVGSGQFRSDLFYRLQVLEIRLPALKQRLEDIPVLVSYFLGLLDHSRHVTVDRAFLNRLSTHNWPGNLRELQNVITYAYTIGKSGMTLDCSHLPDYFLEKCQTTEPHTAADALSDAIDLWLGDTDSLDTYRNLSGDLERLLIEKLLARFDGKLAPMAAALSANRTTIRKKLER
ncbi:MAG: sigma 54-interacting transcriptional regulator [Verrucomicrobiales bacterium]|nr:sigma 54-interacting transcriptional regulator [Verrucomicrobiales bacterium]